MCKCLRRKGLLSNFGRSWRSLSMTKPTENRQVPPPFLNQSVPVPQLFGFRLRCGRQAKTKRATIYAKNPNLGNHFSSLARHHVDPACSYVVSEHGLNSVREQGSGNLFPQKKSPFRPFFFGELFFRLIFAVAFAKHLCGNSSVGRARPCQGRGREFESRFPLQVVWKQTALESKNPCISAICKDFSFSGSATKSSRMQAGMTLLVTYTARTPKGHVQAVNALSCSDLRETFPRYITLIIN